jgi:hypothetical protein
MSKAEETPAPLNEEKRDSAIDKKEPEENSNSHFWGNPNIEEENKGFDQPAQQWGRQQENVSERGGNSSASRGRGSK